MMGGFLRSRHSLRPLRVLAGESQKRRNVLNAIPRRERGEVQAELDGIWSQPTKPEAVAQLAIFKAKYNKRYPEAVRSLAEDEENTFTFFALTREDASTHSDHQCDRKSRRAM